MRYWLLLVIACSFGYLVSYNLAPMVGGGLFFLFESSVWLASLLASSYVFMNSKSSSLSASCLLVGFIAIGAVVVNAATVLDYLYSSSWLGNGLTWYYDTYETWMSALAGGEAAALLIYPITGALNGLYRAGMAGYRFISNYFSRLAEGFVMRHLGLQDYSSSHYGVQRVRGAKL